MMTDPAARWRLGYSGGLVLGSIGLGVAAAFALLTEWAERHGATWLPWASGIVLGGLAGRAIAAATERQPGVHTALLWLGRAAVFGGLGSAGVFVVMYQQAVQENTFLAGLPEMLMAMMSVGGAVVGACFWFAGRSGRSLLRESFGG